MTTRPYCPICHDYLDNRDALDAHVAQHGREGVFGCADGLPDAKPVTRPAPTLEALNLLDNPLDFHGVMLGDDGQGHQLWRFGGAVADRFEIELEGERLIDWSDDVEGWNYSRADALK